APGHRRPEAGEGGGRRAPGAGLPAPDERGHEAARGRRDRDLLRAARHHRGRAHHLARRDHPGPVLAPAARDPGGDEPRADLHHARLRHRREDVRPGDGDVRGACRGERPRAGHLRPAVPSVHPGPAELRAQDGRGRRAALLDHRAAARAVGSSARLPLRPPVPLRRRAVRAGISAVVPGRRGPSRRLLEARARMTAETVLQAQGLKKHFPVTEGMLWTKVVGWVKAVDGISFSIRQGETLAIVGESGCGKTTTAKLVLRLEDPSAGHVFADGKDVHTLDGDALKGYRTTVQAVFQDPWSSLNPRMRVRDIVAEPMTTNLSLSKPLVRERVGDLLARVGLRPEQAELYPHEFSGGQRQRIAVASALVSNPKLIVLDEPVSALDVSIRAQIM